MEQTKKKYFKYILVQPDFFSSLLEDRVKANNFSINEKNILNLFKDHSLSSQQRMELIKNILTLKNLSSITHHRTGEENLIQSLNESEISVNESFKTPEKENSEINTSNDNMQKLIHETPLKITRKNLSHDAQDKFSQTKFIAKPIFDKDTQTSSHQIHSTAVKGKKKSPSVLVPRELTFNDDEIFSYEPNESSENMKLTLPTQPDSGEKSTNEEFVDSRWTEKDFSDTIDFAEAEKHFLDEISRRSSKGFDLEKHTIQFRNIANPEVPTVTIVNDSTQEILLVPKPPEIFEYQKQKSREKRSAQKKKVYESNRSPILLRSKTSDLHKQSWSPYEKNYKSMFHPVAVDESPLPRSDFTYQQFE